MAPAAARPKSPASDRALHRRLAHVAVAALLLATPLMQARAQATAPSSLTARLSPAAAEPGAVVTTPQVRAELLAHAPQGIGPGRALWLGLQLQHQPHWHSYWKNPGDSGLPTTLQWSLPPGVQAGEIRWPTPRPLPLGPLMNFGYDGTVLLPVPATVTEVPAGGALTVRLRADWLVCKDVCIPEGGDFVLRVPADGATALHGAAFDAALAQVPLPPGEGHAARGQAAVEGGTLTLRVEGLPADWRQRPLRVFPEVPTLLASAERPVTAWNGDTWTARMALDPARSASPSSLAMVLVRDDQPRGLQVPVAVTTPWPALPSPGGAAAAAGGAATAEPGTASGAGSGAGPPMPGTQEPRAGVAAPPSPASSAPPAALAGAVLLALAGGVLLNLMPCVFPVLSLKVLGVAGHAGDRRTRLAGAAAYAAGVVLSFVALAALLLALRAGGEQLGWGFQLQSPPVVAALAVLFTLIGLNLAGAFEVGTLLPSSWLTARARHPQADAFLTGVLAVAVASPCTAPFMGAALGAAVALPAAQALAVFAALGLGMALPYVLLMALPGLARRLPRPGPWMAHLRTVLAFPIFATVVWLVWVLGQQAGIDGAAMLLALLLAVAFAAWAFGSPALGPRARGGYGVAAAALLGVVLAWAAPALREAAHETAATPAPEMGSPSVSQPWQPWSAQRVAQAQAAGQPVFVDFTAAWCVTCQLNKRTVLNDADVSADFDRKGVIRLRADWTRRDPAIGAALARLGRGGVPVYALYPPGGGDAVLLPEILSAQAVRAALAALPAGAPPPAAAPPTPAAAAVGAAPAGGG